MGKGFVLGVVVGVLAVLGGAYYYFSSGRAPVGVKDPPMPFEKRLARAALHARFAKEPSEEPLVKPDEPILLSGAVVYRENCAVCHGLPGSSATAIANGLYPPPPQLFKGTGVTDDPAWETYWKAEKGIRLTGMPGFEGSLTKAQLWQVSQLLAHADTISDSVKDALRAEARH